MNYLLQVLLMYQDGSAKNICEQHRWYLLLCMDFCEFTMLTLLYVLWWFNCSTRILYLTNDKTSCSCYQRLWCHLLFTCYKNPIYILSLPLFTHLLVTINIEHSSTTLSCSWCQNILDLLSKLLSLKKKVSSNAAAVVQATTTAWVHSPARELPHVMGMAKIRIMIIIIIIRIRIRLVLLRESWCGLRFTGFITSPLLPSSQSCQLHTWHIDLDSKTMLRLDWGLYWS